MPSYNTIAYVIKNKIPLLVSMFQELQAKYPDRGKMWAWAQLSEDTGIPVETLRRLEKKDIGKNYQRILLTDSEDI